jgi:aryl-alcohol dehydrogenase-like predicted oxidoreductase
MKKKQREFDRREFLWSGVQSLAAFPLVVSLCRRRAPADEPGSSAQTTADSKPVLEYRVLGRTGLKVTAVSYGAMRTRDAAVVHRAIDLGINYIDTADCYMDGNNEKMIGEVLKTRRKEVLVATKVHILEVPEMMASVEKSLTSLQTDVIDVIQIHGMGSKDQMKDPRVMEALSRMKKEGKVRFIGFSTHQNQTELLLESAVMGFYDMVLAGYNFKSPPELGEAIGKAAKAGIGIVAMKTQAGGYSDPSLGNWSPHQAALKWVLKNPGVACAIPSMVNYSQIEENVRVMGQTMGWSDRKKLWAYGNAIDKHLCRMCDACRGKCPKSVLVPDVNRCLMYSKGYGDEDLAIWAFRHLPVSGRPEVCLECSSCTVSCRFGIDVRKHMLDAISRFVSKEVA